MIIKRIEARNFGSYQNIMLDFGQLQGLNLISGPTGSGKSTVCDIIPWGLYGFTAKNGNVDDIRPFGNVDDTEVRIDIVLENKPGLIVRKRGRSSDLYFDLGEGPIRGKDIKDTQKKIDALLGFNLETFLIGSYFHEFSRTSGFFTAAAKTRRTVIEQLVDLSYPVELTAKIKNQTKLTKISIEDVSSRLRELKNIIGMLEHQIRSTKDNISNWEAAHSYKIKELERASLNYKQMHDQKIDTEIALLLNQQSELKKETDDIFVKIDSDKNYAATIESKKQELKNLGTGKCPTCGGNRFSSEIFKLSNDIHRLNLLREENKHHRARLLLIEQELIKINSQIKNLQNSTAENKYEMLLQQLKDETNPYHGVLVIIEKEYAVHMSSLLEFEEEHDSLQCELLDLEILNELVDRLKIELVTESVVRAQNNVNSILSEHFDAAIKVIFDISQSDKIDIVLLKEGHHCAYTQLSKGQRQMLNLSFALSCMNLVNARQYSHFNVLFLDEALDGFDENLKTKAFYLLQKLTDKYESVFVVEHSEVLKNLFDNKLEVNITNGISQIG